MNAIRYTSAVSVDKGLIRNNNEDNFYLDGEHLNEKNRDDSNTFTHNPSNEMQIYGVFDGMGGEALGEVASLIAAQEIEKSHKKLKEKELNTVKTILNTVQNANNRICKKIVDSGERRIGATFSLLSIDDDKATVYNVGDSRVYMLRDGELKQISVDDTTVQRLISMGMITAEQAKTHKDRHRLTQHLGIFNDEMLIEPHVSEPIAVKKDDLFLLCSDGLTDMLEDDEIFEILKQKKNCKELSETLVKAALANGGEDNVTVLVVRADSDKQKASAISYKKYLIPAVALLVCAVAATALLLGTSKDKEAPEKKASSDSDTQVQEGEISSIFFLNPVNTMGVGTENTFMIGMEPAGARGEISFKSSDASIISIDEKTGAYKAVAAGKAVISASSGEKTCEIEIEVYIPIEEIKGVPEKISLEVGGTKKISYSVVPNETTAEAKFSSEDTSVATVSEDGTVAAKAKGTTKITVTVQNLSKTITIEVKTPNEETEAREEREIVETDNEGMEVL